MYPRLQTLVDVHPPEEVTSVNTAAEVEPAAAGLTQKDVDSIWGAAVATYRTGLYPAISLCLRRRGLVVLDRAIGHARGNAPDDLPDAPRTLASPDSLFNLFSASKMVTAMLIHLLDERRLIHLDDPVCHYIPGFERHGKQWITIRHVLTHRAGMPKIPPEQSRVELLAEPRRILTFMMDAKPTLAPGRRLAYHALTGGFVLGEIIERVAGCGIRELLQRELLDPLGFEHFNYGVPASELPLIANNAFTGPPVVPPLSTLMRRALSVDFKEAVRISNDPRFLTAVVPAGNVIATANEACRFMQLLLQGGMLEGVRIFDGRTIARAVAEQSYLELDLTLGLPIRYGMGFMLGSEYMSVYGLHTTHAFGHLGFTNVVLYADPERDISMALMTSGKPFLAPGLTCWLLLLQTIARRCPRDWGRA